MISKNINQIKKSKMQEKTETTVQKFSSFEAEIQTALDESNQLTIVDPKTYIGCRKARTTIQEIISSIETRRKELKTPLIQMGKDIDSTAKDLSLRLVERKSELIGKIKVWDDIKENERKAKEEVERQIKEEIQNKILDFKRVAEAKLNETNDISDLKIMLEIYQSMEITEEIYQDFRTFAQQSLILIIQSIKLKLDGLEKKYAEELEAAKKEYYELKGEDEDSILDEGIPLDFILHEIEVEKESRRIAEELKQKELKKQQKEAAIRLEEKEQALIEMAKKLDDERFESRKAKLIELGHGFTCNEVGFKKNIYDRTDKSFEEFINKIEKDKELEQQPIEIEKELKQKELGQQLIDEPEPDEAFAEIEPNTVNDQKVVNKLRSDIEKDQKAIILYTEQLKAVPAPEVGDDSMKVLLADFRVTIGTNIFNLKDNIKRT